MHNILVTYILNRTSRVILNNLAHLELPEKLFCFCCDAFARVI